MRELISRAEFARRALVTPGAVTKASKKLLKDACVGKRIDFNHPKAKEYISIQVDGPPPKPEKEPHIRGTALVKEEKKKESLESLGDGKIHEVPADIEAFADMPLRELIERFGTETAFMDWLKATKEIELINEKRLKNAQTMGELVARDLIKVGIIEPYDEAHIRLLGDGAKTISVRVVAMVNGGRSTQDVEKYISDKITSFIRPVKGKVSRIMSKIGE